MLDLRRWHIIEYCDFMGSDECTHAELCDFSRRMLKRVHMQVLSHGNTSASQALELVETAAAALGGAPLGQSQLPAPRLLQLPADVDVVLRYHRSLFAPHHQPLFNEDERNSATVLILQAGVDVRPNNLYLQLLAQILNHPCFEQLRTVEQLGYIVSLGCAFDFGVLDLRVIVQSSSHDPDAIDDRVEAFFAGVPALLRGMPASEFQTNKDTIIKEKLEPPKTLRQELRGYWHEIHNGSLDFQHERDDAKVLEGITMADVIDFWEQTFDSKAVGRRKLTSQFWAAHHTLPAKRASGVNGRIMHYVDGVDEAVEYKRTLMAYPCAPRGAQYRALSKKPVRPPPEPPRPPSVVPASATADELPQPPRTYTFGPGPLGMALADHPDESIGGVWVTAVPEDFQAYDLGVEAGRRVLELNGKDVRGLDKADLIGMIGSLGRPLVMTMSAPKPFPESDDDADDDD